jgi:hypothetical protein
MPRSQFVECGEVSVEKREGTVVALAMMGILVKKIRALVFREQTKLVGLGEESLEACAKRVTSKHLLMKEWVVANSWAKEW